MKGKKVLLAEPNELIRKVLEMPIFYHPITVWAAVKGNWDKFVLRKKSWGTQVRKGFTPNVR